MLEYPKQRILCFVIVFLLIFKSDIVAEDKVIGTKVLIPTFDSEDKENTTKVLIPFFEMPTYEVLNQTTVSLSKRVAGTDKWNELIQKVSEEEGIDPIFVKCIMTLESSGYEKTINYNTNGTADYGLMQVNSSWTGQFDFNRMLSDYEYAIRSGIQVIKCKIDACVRANHEPTVFEVAWRYNGYNETGRRYALKFSQLYEDLSKKTSNEIVEIKK